MYVNGKRNAQKGFSVEGEMSEKLSMESNLTLSGLAEFILEMEDDDISIDNKLYLSLNTPEKLAVLLVSNQPDDLKFIELALSTSSNIELRKINFNVFSSVDLNKYDAVVVVGNEDTNLGSLSSYVESGGGLIIFPGSNSTLENFNLLLNIFDLPTVSNVMGAPNSGRAVSTFKKVEVKHPLFLNIFESDEPSIESPNIYYNFNLEPGTKGKSIISLMNNNSFISEYNLGSGRIILFSSAPVLSQTDFPLKGLFAPLMNKSVNYLSSAAQPQESYTCGDVIPVNIADILSPSIKVVRPDNVEEFLAHDSISAGKFLNYSNTGLPGIYNFYSGNNLIQTTAVNIDPNESVLIEAGEDELKELMSNYNFENYILLKQDENISESINQARFGSELWRLFLIVAFILTLIEMIVARNAKKDLAERTNN